MFFGGVYPTRVDRNVYQVFKDGYDVQLSNLGHEYPRMFNWRFLMSNFSEKVMENWPEGDIKFKKKVESAF